MKEKAGRKTKNEKTSTTKRLKTQIKQQRDDWAPTMTEKSKFLT